MALLQHTLANFFYGANILLLTSSLNSPRPFYKCALEKASPARDYKINVLCILLEASNKRETK